MESKHVMLPASQKMDFYSILATHLRERGYTAHIMEFQVRPARFPFLQCVQVGFPRPKLQFFCDNDRCFYRVKARSRLERTVPLDEFILIGSIFDPDLLDKIIKIIHSDY